MLLDYLRSVLRRRRAKRAQQARQRANLLEGQFRTTPLLQQVAASSSPPASVSRLHVNHAQRHAQCGHARKKNC